MGADLVHPAVAFRSDLRAVSERSSRPTVAVAEETHVVIYLNPAFADLVGRDRKDLIGRPFAEAVPEGAGNGCLAVLDRVFRTGLPETLAEQEHRQPDLRPVYWSYAVWAVVGEDERPTGVMVQVTDETEAAAFRRRAAAMNEALVVSSVRQHELIDFIRRGEQERHELQARAFQTQKLESLGVMAGGIAHDLNNILTPVIGFAELAAAALPADSPAAGFLAEVEKNARRAADLVRQILAFAGQGRFVVQPVDLSRLVREMGGLLGAAVPLNTTLEYDLAPGLPLVEADATQLRQVVMNLVKNAAEAGEESAGIIMVRTGTLPAAPPAPRPPDPGAAPPPGPSVFLEVADSGCGMPADVFEKIFDPFFSTKFTGRGLGLSVVQGIARGHRGTLQVRSEPGRGSTFRLLLPRPPEPLPRPDETRRAAEPPRGGTVLVIDDEEAIRVIAARILRGAGMTVLVAADGPEGLGVFREHRGAIDAVILDLTMPGMSGLEAAAALRRERPDLPVVLMSGYSIQEVTRQSAGQGIAGFVEKPFRIPDLLAAVRNALAR